MKMMKKVISIGLAAMLLTLSMASLVGCGDKEEKILKVGVKADVKGFGLKDATSGTYSGMEVELAEKIAEALGYDGVEYTNVTAKTRTELLDNGTLDCVLATFTITEARKESWDFSTAYYQDAVTVLVNKSSDITSIDALVGKTVGVSSSSTSAKALVTAMSEKGLCDAPAHELCRYAYEGDVIFVEFPDYPSILQGVTAGTIDAFCVDKSILSNYMSDGRRFVDERVSPQEYGVATKKDAEISKQIDELIVKWLADGTIDALIKKYGIE